MFKYEITPTLLLNLKKIATEVHDLNSQKFSDPVLFEMEAEANAQSSHSSTSIEGNPLPLTEVKKILKSQPTRIRDTEREVLNYNEALLWLKNLLSSKKFALDEKVISEIHKIVTHKLLPKYSSGKMRTEPVFVNDPKKRKTIYWPPDHQDLKGLLRKLIQFVNKQRFHLDPIILAGIFHRQFVIIHPFIDGNGRTVRLATKALLADIGVDTFHLFSFENYYNRNVTKYFEKVGVRGNYYDIAENVTFTAWLEYFSGGILDELYRVRKILEQSNKKITANVNPSNLISSDQEKIIHFIKKHGYIRDKDYAKLTARAKATRTLDFKKLIRLGLIERRGNGPATHYLLKA